MEKKVLLSFTPELTFRSFMNDIIKNYNVEINIVKADIEAIIQGVVRETGVTEVEMCDKGRQREYAEARAIVSWLARRYTSMTLTSIGKRLGRDHISVIHYVRMVGSWMEEPRLNMRGARITQKLIDEIEQ